MKLKSLLIVVSITLASKCFAQNEEKPKPDWIYVTSTNTSSLYMKSTSTKSYSEDIQVWVREQFSTKKVRGKVYNKPYSLTLYSFECETQYLKPEQKITYSYSGNVIESVPSYEFVLSRAAVIPGTIGESLLNMACKLFKK